MKLRIALAIASLTLAAIANADYSTSTTVGNTTYHSGTWGTATSSRVGGTVYHSGDLGTGTSTKIGNTTYHNW